jgi:hypothetical protein
MNVIKVEIEGKVTQFNVKSHWGEMGFDDLKVASALVFQIGERNAALLNLLVQLADCDRKTLQGLGERMLRDDDGVVAFVALCDCLNFVMETKPNYDLSEAATYGDFDGPADYLSNIRVKQMRKVEQYFEIFMETQDQVDLNCLLSHLYFKDTYIPERAPKMMKVVAAWPLEDRFALLLNYMALRNAWMEVGESDDQKIRELDDESTFAKASVDEEESTYAKASVDEEPEPRADFGHKVSSLAELLENIPFDLSDGKRYGSIKDVDEMFMPDLLAAIRHRNEEVNSQAER